jgi:glutathione S-transferase
MFPDEAAPRYVLPPRHLSPDEFDMMILRSSPPSPFGRKAVIAAGVLGLSSELTIEKADPNDPGDSVRVQNPVGKIPVLIDESGAAYFDSRVILEYLDHRAGGGRILPAAPQPRFDALRLQALCDGALDACILLVYEGRWRTPEHHEAKWLAYQNDKVARALNVLEASPPAIDPVPSVGQIALACLLGYRDLRFAATWRADYPKLVAWLDAFAAQVPAFAQTRVTS